MTQRVASRGTPPDPAAPAEGTEKDPAANFWSVIKWLRRGLLVALVAWAARELLVDGLPRACGEEVADGAAVTVCRSMGITDPRVGLFLLTVGLLLLPDLSEVEVPGIVRLQRKVEAARAEVTELTGELVGVRNQISTLTAAQSVAAARSSSSGNNLSVFMPAQAAETGAALLDINSGDTTVLEPEEEDGSFGLLAFEAAMRGLLDLLPRDGDGASVVGMTFDDQGELTWHAQTGAALDRRTVEQLIDQARALPGELHVAGNGDWWTVTAPATVSDGQVGAVGVLLPDDRVDQSEEATRRAAEVGQATELVAGTYGRMLVALLGEQPVPTPGAGAGEGQVRSW